MEKLKIAMDALTKIKDHSWAKDRFYISCVKANATLSEGKCLGFRKAADIAAQAIKNIEGLS